MSCRAAATEVPTSAGHMSRVIRGADGKRATPTVLRRISEILGLPSDFFIVTVPKLAALRVASSLGACRARLP